MDNQEGIDDIKLKFEAEKIKLREEREKRTETLSMYLSTFDLL